MKGLCNKLVCAAMVVIVAAGILVSIALDFSAGKYKEGSFRYKLGKPVAEMLHMKTAAKTAE